MDMIIICRIADSPIASTSLSADPKNNMKYEWMNELGSSVAVSNQRSSSVAINRGKYLYFPFACIESVSQRNSLVYWKCQRTDHLVVSTSVTLVVASIWNPPTHRSRVLVGIIECCLNAIVLYFCFHCFCTEKDKQRCTRSIFHMHYARYVVVVTALFSNFVFSHFPMKSTVNDILRPQKNDIAFFSSIFVVVVNLKELKTL